MKVMKLSNKVVGEFICCLGGYVSLEYLKRFPRQFKIVCKRAYKHG